VTSGSAAAPEVRSGRARNRDQDERRAHSWAAPDGRRASPPATDSARATRAASGVCTSRLSDAVAATPRPWRHELTSRRCKRPTIGSPVALMRQWHSTRRRPASVPRLRALSPVAGWAEVLGPPGLEGRTIEPGYGASGWEHRGGLVTVVTPRGWVLGRGGFGGRTRGLFESHAAFLALDAFKAHDDEREPAIAAGWIARGDRRD
jgi:hypothetical protein